MFNIQYFFPRPVGSDMKKDELLFDTKGPYGIPQKSVLASVGLLPPKQLVTMFNKAIYQNNLYHIILRTESENCDFDNWR